jgi:hypothetical protein
MLHKLSGSRPETQIVAIGKLNDNIYIIEVRAFIND